MSRLWSVAVLVFILGTVAVPAGRSVEPLTADKPGPADKDQSDATGKAATDAAALLPKVLREWEKATHAARESRCIFTWTSCDLVHGTRETYRGEVFVCMPDRLRVEVRDAAGKLAFLVVCADGKAKMYWYSTKKFLAFPLDLSTGVPGGKPALKYQEYGWLGDLLWNSTLEWGSEASWIVLGFPVWDLKERCDVRVEKEDDYWTHVRLSPKKRGRRLPDADWQVVLAKEGRWVRRV